MTIRTKLDKAIIAETSLEYFLYGGRLKKARYIYFLLVISIRYGVSHLEFFLKAGGTCYT